MELGRVSCVRGRFCRVSCGRDRFCEGGFQDTPEATAWNLGGAVCREGGRGVNVDMLSLLFLVFGNTLL